MFSKYNLYVIASCFFLMTTVVSAQPGQDSTNLPKMQESNFKAMEPEVSLTVLTKGNIKKTFEGLQVTIDNSGAYSTYHEDLQYKVIERSGKLAIQKYTPKITCSTYMNREGVELCRSDDKKLAGRFSIMCVIPQGAKSCKSSSGSYYELTLSGLLMGESYATCWRVLEPIVNWRTVCGYQHRAQKVYIWNTPVATK